MIVELQPITTYWACPSCLVRDQTLETRPHARLHPCPGMSGMTVPMVQVAHPDDIPDARHRINYREDYIGDEDAGPIMSVNTDHGDGSSDCTIYAPTAHVAAHNPN